MNLTERLRLLIAALPSDDAAVTLTRAQLAVLLRDLDLPADEVTSDLTADEVAAETRRAPSTVRSWLISGELRGYKLNGKDWRIPRDALRAFLDAQGGHEKRRGQVVDEGVDITEWRKSPA